MCHTPLDDFFLSFLIFFSRSFLVSQLHFPIQSIFSAMVARPERMAARYLAGRMGQSGQSGNGLEIFFGSKKFSTDSVAFRLKHMILYRDSKTSATAANCSLLLLPSPSSHTRSEKLDYVLVCQLYYFTTLPTPHCFLNISQAFLSRHHNSPRSSSPPHISVDSQRPLLSEHTPPKCQAV